MQEPLESSLWDRLTELLQGIITDRDLPSILRVTRYEFSFCLCAHRCLKYPELRWEVRLILCLLLGAEKLPETLIVLGTTFTKANSC